MLRRPMVKPTVLLCCTLVATIGAGAGVALAAGDLKAFLLRSGEQTGFRVVGHDTTWTTAAGFVKDGGEKGKAARRDTKALKAAGFKRAINEQLAGSGGAQGFSLVVQLGSRAGATRLARTLALRASKQAPGKLSRFKVPGVRSARGYAWVGPKGKPSVANVYWTIRRCTLGSGDYLPRGESPAKPLIAGVKALLRRLGHVCP